MTLTLRRMFANVYLEMPSWAGGRAGLPLKSASSTIQEGGPLRTRCGICIRGGIDSDRAILVFVVLPTGILLARTELQASRTACARVRGCSPRPGHAKRSNPDTRHASSVRPHRRQTSSAGALRGAPPSRAAPRPDATGSRRERVGTGCPALPRANDARRRVINLETIVRPAVLVCRDAPADTSSFTCMDGKIS